MEKISEARKDKEFPTLIHFWGNTIKINERKKYPERAEKYKNAVGNEETLKQLDKEFAEEIVLDYGNMIEFSSTEKFENKTAEEEAKASFERLEKNEKYTKKIELIKKTHGETTHFIIKRTEVQIKELERAERAYERLHETEIKEPTKQTITTEEEITEWPQQWIPTLEKVEPLNAKETKSLEEHMRRLLWIQLKNIKINEITDIKMPDGKIIRLQKKNQYGRECLFNQVHGFNEYIQHEKDENDDKKHARVSNEALWKFLQIPKEQLLLPPHKQLLLLPPHQEEIIPVPEDWEEVELTATISDTTQITRAIAERQAGEELRKIYKNTAR